MNKQVHHYEKIYQRQKIWIVCLFLLLVIIHNGLIIGYFKIFVDALQAKVVIKTLVQSRIHTIVDAFEPMKGPIHVERIVKILDDMLLLEDTDTKAHFISGVKLEMDYDVVNAEAHKLDIERGETQGEYFLIPIYSKATRELIGIAKFYSKELSFKQSRMKYSMAMLIGAFSTLLFTLIALWLILTRLFTKIKKTERELQEKHAQLIHAGRLKAMGEMAAGIAHEINQPLQVIKSAAPYLDAYFKNNAPNSVEAEAARDILKHVDRVIGIIKNMVSFVRKKSDNHEYISLYNPISKALSFFAEQFKHHDILLEVPGRSFMMGLPSVRINAQEFMQIVVNLLSNARDAVDKKGESDGGQGFKKSVALRLFNDKEKGMIIFEVEDNGIGMSKVEQSRCMEPFYTTKEVGEGMGLGLSIVHSLTKKYNMCIQIKSIEGEGTLVSIMIPIRG